MSQKISNVLDFIESCNNCKMGLKQCKFWWGATMIERRYAFMVICNKKYFLLAQQLYLWGNTPIGSQWAFQKCCWNGHFKMVKWIYSFGGVYIYSNGGVSFLSACKNGYLDIVQWMRLKCPNIIYDNVGFMGACKYGHIDIAKWLYKNGKINIHMGHDTPFLSACKRGHFQIAKWIYTTDNIDIKIINQMVFTPYIKCNKEIYEWLMRLGARPNPYHLSYYYYKKYKKEQFLASVILTMFVIKVQRSFRGYLYNPDNGIFMIKAKERFITMQ